MRPTIAVVAARSRAARCRWACGARTCRRRSAPAAPRRWPAPPSGARISCAASPALQARADDALAVDQRRVEAHRREQPRAGAPRGAAAGCRRARLRGSTASRPGTSTRPPRGPMQPTWLARCACAITSSSTPRRRSAAWASGIRPSPQTLSRGKSCWSTSTTSQPGARQHCARRRCRPGRRRRRARRRIRAGLRRASGTGGLEQARIVGSHPIQAVRCLRLHTRTRCRRASDARTTRRPEVAEAAVRRPRAGAARRRPPWPGRRRVQPLQRGAAGRQPPVPDQPARPALERDRPQDIVLVDEPARVLQGRHRVEPTAMFIHAAAHRITGQAWCCTPTCPMPPR